MRWCVMQKNWFTIFNVKVTARASIIKIWLFLLYVLNYWSICNQTVFNSTALWTLVPCGKMGLLRKVMVTAKVQNVFWTTEHFVTKPGMVMQHHKPECHSEKLVQCSVSRSQQGLTSSKYDYVVSSKLLARLQPNMVWWYNIISRSVEWKSGITAFKVKVTVKVWNVSECLSWWSLLIHRTFCYQVWYGDAALWARVFCGNFFLLLLSSRSRSQLGLIW